MDKLDYVEGENGYVLASESALQYKYKFNGIELQEELGLNWYDMDFRDYDPAIARWTGIDPVTHHSMSPYMAFDGNPVFWADPSGADVILYNNVIEAEGSDAAGYYNAIIGAMDGNTIVYKIQGEVLDQRHTEYLPTMTVTRGSLYGAGSSGSGGFSASVQNHSYKHSQFYQNLRDERKHAELTKIARGFQDMGDTISLIGYGLTLSVVGAEIGIPLAAIGNVISVTGAAIGVFNDLYYAKYAESSQGAALTAAGQILPKIIKIPGLENLGEKILEQNIAIKVMGTERLINHLQTNQ